MKTYRTRGSNIQRPYYKPTEVEEICDKALHSSGLHPTEPGPIRIDRFVEKHFGVEIVYDDELPVEILGYTRFGKDGVEQVVVTSKLDVSGQKSQERRLRSTIAHEAGHGLLHTHLFVLGTKNLSLFGGADTTPQLLCRDDITHNQSKVQKGDWWEVQANMTIGPLLLPREMLEVALQPYMEGAGFFNIPVLPQDREDEAIIQLADIFDVNPVVARFRIDRWRELTGQK